MKPPQARNAIKKALVAIIDPHPKKAEIDAMWTHFENSCAFCGMELNRRDRKGHADHLIPSAKGGRNHIYNRVLACSTCNGDVKLASPWLTFLRSRPGSKTQKTSRIRRIKTWQTRHLAECTLVDEKIAEALKAAEKAIAAFDTACRRVRALR